MSWTPTPGGEKCVIIAPGGLDLANHWISAISDSNQLFIYTFWVINAEHRRYNAVDSGDRYRVSSKTVPTL